MIADMCNIETDQTPDQPRKRDYLHDVPHGALVYQYRLLETDYHGLMSIVRVLVGIILVLAGVALAGWVS